LSASASARDRLGPLLAPADAVCLEVPRGRVERRAAAARLRALEPGSHIVLRGRRGAVQRVVRAARLDVVRDLIALPSARSPAFLIEDAAAPMSLLCGDILGVPPGVTALVAPTDALLRVARRAARWRWFRRLLVWRVVVARR